MIKKILGFIILAAMFLGLFAQIVMSAGVGGALVIFGAVVGIVALVMFAVWLLTS